MSYELGFVKPVDLFLKRKRKNNCVSPQSRKKFIISPLKCIDLNSPVKDSQRLSLARQSVGNGNGRRVPCKVTPRKIVFASHQTLSYLPIDWTLKTKMRFVSTKNFRYRGVLTSIENASGTTAFSRCLFSKESASLDTSVSSELKKNCFVWTFPYLPGYEVFPRINNRCKVAPISEPMINDLFTNYCESIKDLYDLLKARQCAYFYVCGHSFTALFRAASVGGFDEIHAIITPTTEGFRGKLKEEGIEFTMPLLEEEMELEKRREEEIATLEKNFNDEQKGEENIIKDVNDDDASSFLTGLGIDPTESQNQNFKRRKGLSKQVFESTLVLVKGVHTQGLIPFLSNRLVILAITGSLARVPPTLISPVAFTWAHLQYLTPKYNRFVEDSGETFNLEIKGPITPAMVINFCELFQTVLGEFKLYLTNYGYATPLNNVRSEEKGNKAKATLAKANLKDCGLSDNVVESLCSEEKQSLQAYTTIFCEKGRYFPS